MIKKVLFVLVSTSLIYYFFSIYYFSPEHTVGEVIVNVNSTANINSISDSNDSINSKSAQMSNQQPLSVDVDISRSLEDSNIEAMALIKENVPSPSLAFDKNINLTWDDYLAILEQFDTFGSPINYERKPTDELLQGHWWIEHDGYDDEGEAIFIITDLYSFSEKSYELTEKIHDVELRELNNSDSFGEFDLAMENLARDYLSSASVDAESVVCRLSKCLFKIQQTEHSDFDLRTYTNKIKAEMEKSNSNKECIVISAPIKPKGNTIDISCNST